MTIKNILVYMCIVFSVVHIFLLVKIYLRLMDKL